MKHVIDSLYTKVIRASNIYANSGQDGVEVQCYAIAWPPAPEPPSPTEFERFEDIVKSNTALKVVLFILAPITAIALSIRSAKKLQQREHFSALYAIYKSFLRVIIMSMIFGAIGISTYFLSARDLTWYVMLIPAGLLGVICMSTGLGYLLFVRKDLRFLRLGLAYFLVLPGIVVALVILVLSIVPALNKYLPKDAAEFRKKQLKQRLINEGKIPT